MTRTPARVTRRRFTALVLGTLGTIVTSRVDAAPADRYASNFDGLALVDQDGRPFRFEQLAGQVLLVNFVYTGCSTTCPVQTHDLATVQAALPDAIRGRVSFVSVSIDPLSDTPAALKAYALRMGANLARWRFVTGPRDDIDRVAARLRLFRAGDRVVRPDDHATALWLVDAAGRLRQRLPGVPVDRDRVRDELTALVRLAGSSAPASTTN